VGRVVEKALASKELSVWHTIGGDVWKNTDTRERKRERREEADDEVPRWRAPDEACRSMVEREGKKWEGVTS